MAGKIEPRSRDDLLQSDGHFVNQTDLMGFHKERGITQGDTMTAVAWVAVFDILLTFLDNIPGTEDVAYADDILNFSSELAGVQLKADQISALPAWRSHVRK
jgi:hypothetical protein